MAYETLIAALLQEGDAKRKAVLGHARSEADRLIAEANAAAEALDREADAAARREVTSRRTAILGQAALAARQTFLTAKHEVLEAVWRQVTEEALALTGTERAGVLRALLDELLAAAPPGPFKAVIDSRERAHLEGLLEARRIPFEQQHRDDLLLGVELEAEGEVLRSSLIARMAKAKPDLVIELNRLLFAPHPDPLPASGERDG
jgi:vacuolar-type H+-ATPase subunit E/Vma4